MADLKISQLSDGGASQATDEYVVARSGSNFRIDGASVAAAATSVGTLTSLTVSGTATVTGSEAVLAPSTNTNAAQLRLANGGGNYYVAVDSSTGGNFGAGAYGFALYLPGGMLLKADKTSLAATFGGAVTMPGDLTVDTSTLKVDSANNRVGIGTASPAKALEIASGDVRLSDGYTISWGSDDYRIFRNGTQIRFDTAGVQRMTLDASGNLGLGVTPSAWASSFKAIDLGGSGSISYTPGGATQTTIATNAYYDTTDGRWEYKNTGDKAARYAVWGDGSHAWYVTNTTGTANNAITFTQAMTLDASGNLLVGTTSTTVWNGAAGTKFVMGGANNTIMSLQSSSTSVDQGVIYEGLSSAVTSGSRALGSIAFLRSNTSTTACSSYTSFYTNNAGTVGERARITSGGDFLVRKTSSGLTNVGFECRQVDVNTPVIQSTTAGYWTAAFNRKSDDGDIVLFYQDDVQEGSISVSGNTVSYNAFAGSHWSQLEDGSKPEILRGTVMEALNQLCEWPNEQNERLPKAKVSDTAGSKKVYGVFMDWDNDWTETNDMLVTSVGAFICRVAADVVVEQGDLLESNGDGTARVQADDVIRSSTIGKVTSTVKTHEYEDGTYCVPTVLYCG